MKGGLGNIMKQAQKLQEDMQKAQEEIAAMEITGEAGAGMVKVLMTGKQEVRKVDIDPSLFEDDREMVEDLVAAAFNDAVQKVQRESQDRMSGMAESMGLPPGMQMPF